MHLYWHLPVELSCPKNSIFLQDVLLAVEREMLFSLVRFLKNYRSYVISSYYINIYIAGTWALELWFHFLLYLEGYCRFSILVYISFIFILIIPAFGRDFEDYRIIIISLEFYFYLFNEIQFFGHLFTISYLYRIIC